MNKIVLVFVDHGITHSLSNRGSLTGDTFTGGFRLIRLSVHEGEGLLLHLQGSEYDFR